MTLSRRAVSFFLAVTAGLPGAAGAQIVLGPESRVNTYTTQSQASPAVAPTGDGGFVVVWTSYNQVFTGADVFARVFGAGGVPLTGEFRVNEHTTGTQYQPAVAADANGNFVVVWSSNAEGSSFGVFGRRFDASGDPREGEFRVNTWTTGVQASPDVTSDAAGNFVVAWSGAGLTDPDGVFVQRYDTLGGAQGAQIRVNTYTTSGQSVPSVASDADGNLVVVWHSLNQPPDVFNFGVFGQRLDSSGTKQGPEFMANEYTLNSQARPRVAADADGSFVVAWHGQYAGGDFGVAARRFDAAGAASGAEFRVNAWTTNTQASPDVAAHPAGDFVVAWQSEFQDGFSSGAFARPFLGSGAAGDEFRANSYTTGGQARPRVAWTGDAEFVVVWSGQGAGDTSGGVFFRRFAPEIIFADGFEGGGLGAWSSAATDGGDLTVATAAGLRTSSLGLMGVVDDTSGLFVQDDRPQDESRYRARFWFHTNGFDPGEAQNRFRMRLFLAFEENPNLRLVAVVLRRLGGLYYVRARVRLDDGTRADTAFFPIADGPHAIELDWRRATAPGAGDGAFDFYIDGNPMATLSGLDNGASAVDFVRLGALSVKPGASGTLYWDEFESHRQRHIGP